MGAVQRLLALLGYRLVRLPNPRTVYVPSGAVITTKAE